MALSLNSYSQIKRAMADISLQSSEQFKHRKTSCHYSSYRLQTIKDIFLFCKSCLGLSSVPETKLLVMWLIRDIIER
jgi:hypothetical protein